MAAISSIYIPHIKKDSNAEFIAYIFERNLIAQVSRVAIEYNKKTKKYSAYVGIEYWHDTETAYNFIKRLNNPNKETTLIYRDDDWWTVKINNFPHKVLIGSRRRILTLFKLEDIVYKKDIKIDYERTKLLRSILSQIQDKDEIKIDYERTNRLKSILFQFQDINQEQDRAEFDQEWKAEEEDFHMNYEKELEYYELRQDEEDYEDYWCESEFLRQF